jgi:hypothetical protein
MKFNVHSTKKDLTGLMIFDYLHAWRHNLVTNQASDVDYIVTDPGQFLDGYIDILYLDIHEHPFPSWQLDEADRYDFIFLDNHSDALCTSSEIMIKLINQYKHAYLVIDSFLDLEHTYAHKYIPVCADHYAIKEFWIDSRYPTSYFSDHYKDVLRKYNMIYINGTNRSWRQYSLDLLKQEIPNLPTISNYNKLVVTNDSFFESAQDTEFKKFVNDKYQGSYVKETTSKGGESYYNEGIRIGSNGKFGEILPGYMIMKEYFEYQCVVFPESTWQNNELAITEKSWKCFFTKSIPMPIGGSNIHGLYNQLGLATAWNLLPKSLQEFDQIENHQQRYQGVTKAVKWLHDNPDIFNSEQAKQIVDSNYRRCFSPVTHAKSSEILYNILLTGRKK